VRILLDSKVICLVMSSEFVRKQEFKLKKIKDLYVVTTNISGSENVQTYIRLVYFYYSYIGVYKRNLIENIL